MTKSTRRVTVVVPAWNSGRWLPACLEALARQTFQNFEIILVDDGSTEDIGSPAEQDFDLVKLPANRGFAAAVNAGIRRSASPFVVLLNADTVARSGWLAALVDRMEQSPDEVGAVGSKMLLMDDPSRIEDAGNTLSWYGSATKRGRGEPATTYTESAEVFSVCAAAALYRRTFFDDVGLFDERFESYFEDIELGLRGRLRGWRYLYEATAEVLHQGHGSGLSRARYVSLMTRNRLLTFFKTIPAPLLGRHLLRLLYGQFYFFVVYHKPLASLVGYAKAARLMPEVFSDRRPILGQRRLSDAQISRLLTIELGEPTLRKLLARNVLRKRRTREGYGE